MCVKCTLADNMMCLRGCRLLLYIQCLMDVVYVLMRRDCKNTYICCCWMVCGHTRRAPEMPRRRDRDDSQIAFACVCLHLNGCSWCAEATPGQGRLEINKDLCVMSVIYRYAKCSVDPLWSPVSVWHCFFGMLIYIIAVAVHRLW